MKLDGAKTTRLDSKVTLYAKGVRGEAEVRRPRPERRSAFEDGSLTQAAEEAGIRFDSVIELDLKAPKSSPGATRSEETDPIELEIRPNPDETLALLHTDENGYSHWIFPEPDRTGSAEVRSSSAQRFVLPGQITEALAASSERRGPLAKLGRRLVRVFAGKIAELIQAPLLELARRWEEKNRPYGLIRFPFDGTSAEKFSGRRALVLVHGTFSTGPGGFGDLAGEAEWLTKAYGGQVVAFNHPSLSEDPRQNAEVLWDELRKRMPNGELEIDLISHSRGGLVVRALMGLVRADDRLRVRRAVLVAAPLAGTRLTDGEHAHEMLDRYTNLVTALPDGVLGYGFETILALVKILYRGSVTGLPGLRSMAVDGDFLKQLGYEDEEFERYFSIVSNFVPTSGGPLTGLLRRAGDGFIDDLFGHDNDLVVPTEGGSVWTVGAVPKEQRLVLPTEADPDEVHHGTYFTSGKVRATIRDWLE